MTVEREGIADEESRRQVEARDCAGRRISATKRRNCPERLRIADERRVDRMRQVFRIPRRNCSTELAADDVHCRVDLDGRSSSRGDGAERPCGILEQLLELEPTAHREAALKSWSGERVEAKVIEDLVLEGDCHTTQRDLVRRLQ